MGEARNPILEHVGIRAAVRFLSLGAVAVALGLGLALSPLVADPRPVGVVVALAGVVPLWLAYRSLMRPRP